MAEIVVASHHGSLAELMSDTEFCALAKRDGFLIELRLDQYSDLNKVPFVRAVASFSPDVVVTFRHPAEGGKNAAAGDAERVQWLAGAAQIDAPYIDIEARTDRAGFTKGKARLALSFHDFEKVPDFDALLNQWESMAAQSDVDVVKIACFPKTIHDTAPLLKLLRIAQERKRASVILAMGEAGFWTRICGPLFGAPFTFSRAESTNGTAPGQPTWRELDELYRYREIRPGWPVYGVIGNPIGHSLSPLMHNTGFKSLGIPGVYLPFKVEGDPVSFVKEFEALGLRGLSVTIPHKETVMAACAEIDPIAQSIGAVNTLTLTERGWRGSNTDAIAAADALERVAGRLKGRHVLILGAGGAAKAVAFGVKARGADVSILNRTRERAEALATAVGGSVITYEDLKHAKKIDAVVNSTPIGMHPNVDASPLELDQIPRGSIVFDTVYNPLRTKLLKLAESAGCQTIEGVNMFIGQGVRQFEQWTGKTAPREEMEQAVLAALKARNRG